jgi:hypothetical protein
MCGMTRRNMPVRLASGVPGLAFTAGGPMAFRDGDGLGAVTSSHSAAERMCSAIVRKHGIM